MRRRHYWLGAALALAALPAPTRGGTAPDGKPAGTPKQSRVDLPDGPAFRQILDLSVEHKPLDEVVKMLEKEHGLPLSLAEGLGAEKTPVTIEVRQAAVEAVLNAVAVALGDGYRWRRKGESLELAHVAGHRWDRAASPEAAGDLLRALQDEGLLPNGERTPSRSLPEEVALPLREANDAALRFAAELQRSLPPELAEAAGSSGVPVAKLHPEVQQAAYDLLIRGLRTGAVRSMAGGAREAANNPLVTGTAIPGLTVAKRDAGGWMGWYLSSIVDGKPGLGLPLCGPRVRQWGPGQAPPP